MASNSEAFEAVTEAVAQNLALQIEFAGIGISLMNRKMIEVIYVTISALKFEYTDSNIAQTVNLSCGSLQIDNQLHDAIYPVILQPTPIDKESSGVAALSTVQGSVVWLKDQGMNM
jgi:vacuolar protein sorting-associated protein 13A/C